MAETDELTVAAAVAPRRVLGRHRHDETLHGRGSGWPASRARWLGPVAGDEASFRVLFDRFAPVLFRLVRRRLPTEDHARDVVQQTLLHMHRARRDFRADSRLRPWLFTIAMNLVREHYRWEDAFGVFNQAIGEVSKSFALPPDAAGP